MQGMITSFNSDDGTGLIKDRTGDEYSFVLFEWNSPRLSPTPKMAVIFQGTKGKKLIARNIRPANSLRQAH